MTERTEAIREWAEAARRMHGEGHLEQNSCCTMVDEEVPWLLDRVERLEGALEEIAQLTQADPPSTEARIAREALEAE